ncbi:MULTISPECIES: ABC transporter ATP-binding protein [unclassified Ruegeria]|uniref:ABC transporter ATP-binding protein n=1 Tax=unclassified Ruegeria TaxID=2625375 RepID=UPI001488D14C|nr:MULTISPECIES: ABC transporter ATP-binding protein [unclassified Ruegeria]NOD76933.1 ATP-binding cassette domain-containing protein [Ruegeria sp. HKCCD4332]NOD88456.1 ATP-binding cassette domain-containing protein [Ruegeria sp. HKCCD4318]NOE13365.1 ATP-binding cassette domain-containing protein [Ruegeria sp. HKCCD4318-2]NOG11093.1 ABC transporter ATP-binding protein [Ruegeria sp. HKCCD4315]
MTDKALTIDHVLKDRGKTRVLDDITLSLAPGQRVALLGHNGAGKSTLIKSILGLTPIHGGAIRIGDATPGSAQARRETAYLPEAVSFHPALTGREQLTLFAKLSGAKADVPGLLERVGLSDALDRRIGAYSKGMRQRLGLAQVLLGQPKVALLDEPTSGLDPISRQDLYAIIDELAAQGTAVLIASHALTEVEARTDRIAIMRKGRMVVDDTLNNLSALAGLPIRLKVRASANADALAAELGGNRINGASVELLCTPADKMEALRRIAGMGDAVADVEMTPPKLEDLYRHYAQEELQ